MGRCEAVVLVKDEESHSVCVECFPVEMADVGDLNVRDDEGWAEEDGKYGSHSDRLVMVLV